MCRYFYFCFHFVLLPFNKLNRLVYLFSSLHKMDEDNSVSEEEEIVDIYQEHKSLLEAIDNHNCALVHDLVHNKGLCPNINVDGQTPICRAAQVGFVDILDILVEGGCSLFTADADIWRRQALHIAASKGHIEFARRLLEYGADVNTRDDDERTPLHWAATYGNPLMASFLLNVGAAVNIAQCDGFTPLHAATCLGHNNVCKVLLEHGAEINRTDRDGWSPFHTAVCYGHKEVVQTLLEAGASLTKLTNDEVNVVHIAASSGKLDVLKLTLDYGADLNALTMSGSTPFYLSIYYGEFEVVRFFIKIGADMYVTNGPKKTPFYLAAAKCHMPIMFLMMEGGYNLSCEEWVLQKEFPQVLHKLPEFCNLLYRVGANPRSLKNLSRFRIRNAIKYDTDFENSLNSLQLPSCLKEYISYSDLDGIGKTSITASTDTPPAVGWL